MTDTDTNPLANVFRVVWLQMIITIVAAIGFSYLGFVAFYSALMGGGIAIASNFYFVRVAYSAKRRAHPKNFVSGLYIGEVLKFIVIVALFGLVFKLHGEGKLAVNPIALFVCFIATSGAYWYALKTYR